MSQFDAHEDEHGGIRTPPMFQPGHGGQVSLVCLVVGALLGFVGWSLLGDTTGGSGEAATGQILISLGSVLVAIGVIALGVRIGIREALGSRRPE